MKPMTPVETLTEKVKYYKEQMKNSQRKMGIFKKMDDDKRKTVTSEYAQSIYKHEAAIKSLQ